VEAEDVVAALFVKAVCSRAWASPIWI